jgi:hypothetical protein
MSEVVGMRWIPLSVLIVVVLSVGVVAVTIAEEEPLRDEAPAEKKAPVADEARVRALIEKLGSAEFGAREKAFEELARIGKAAEPLLREALESEDLQVRKSAEKLLEKLASEEKAPRAEERLAPDRWPERSAEEWLRRMRELGLPIEDEEFERHLEELRERMLRLQKELGAPEIELGPEGQLGERHTILRSDDETVDCRVDSTGKVTVKITKPGRGRKSEDGGLRGPGREGLREEAL